MHAPVHRSTKTPLQANKLINKLSPAILGYLVSVSGVACCGDVTASAMHRPNHTDPIIVRNSLMRCLSCELVEIKTVSCKDDCKNVSILYRVSMAQKAIRCDAAGGMSLS